ncbi:survival protein sure-like phosphatase/nucleotidase [Xylariaceae sp. FL0255]|nr:survival protein sure-like phosphatase/nucleotidase [Xylariaceae sp. FL0255]
MHILVTNDDGPPSPASPYVHALVRGLQRAGHVVSVCLPDTQRSWIGKAHMIGKTVKPVYYRPPKEYDPQNADGGHAASLTYSRPASSQRLIRKTEDEKEEEEVEEWVLVDGTPASCAQIGLHHAFAHTSRGPIDLVVSGPNFGRNSTALFALSSGTLGAALEAAVCRAKSIALSYAHFKPRQDPKDPEIVKVATEHSIKVIEALYKRWPSDGSVDVYTVNVPLLPGLLKGETKAIYTPMLQNYWGEGGTCFVEVEGSVDGDADEREEEEEGIRAEEGKNGDEVDDSREEGENKGTAGLRHRHFKWQPRFLDVYQSVEDAPPGNDGWAVKEGHTSVTPLKANFWQTSHHLHGTELELEMPISNHHPHQQEENPLPSSSVHASVPTSNSMVLSLRPKDHFYALVAYEDDYVQPLILDALKRLFPPESYTLLSAPVSEAEDGVINPSALLPADTSNSSNGKILQISPYEAIDWDYVSTHPRTCVVNSYMLRKALIRKHYLSATVEHWVAKRPGSCLKRGVKRSETFEVDYAEFLDDALVECFGLRDSLERNLGIIERGGEKGEGNGKGQGSVEWWILKPGMSDRGQGIKLFCTMEQLQGIFDEWETERPESEDGDDDDDDDEDDGANTNSKRERKNDDDDDGDYITTSQLRHFVAQPYIDPPLLLPGDGRKFHIRTYVACIGNLEIYVYKPMLALFAAKPYVSPSLPCHSNSSHEGEQGEEEMKEAKIDLESHLTNTCLQRSVAADTVRPFWSSSFPLSSATKSNIFDQICALTGDVFEAAARGMQMHFRPLENAFEIYGLDFLVDEQEGVWLLEVNAFPDFRQSGDELKVLVGGLWREVIGKVVGGLLLGKGGQREGKGGEKAEGEREDADGLILVRRVELGGW